MVTERSHRQDAQEGTESKNESSYTDAVEDLHDLGLYRRCIDGEDHERHLNIHLDPALLAGVYANLANVSFSDYEFTLTFARIDHEVEEGDVPGVVVSRVNVSQKLMRELIDAMEDAWSKWTTSEGIKNLPETPTRPE